MRQLTTLRRVVFPLRHPDFALDDDQVSHGARLWANLLSLMATHAWIEQKNRSLLDLGQAQEGEGAVAIEATPDDYEAAYRIFTKVCKRTVVNLSESHRKILNGLHELQQTDTGRYGFTQREIAKAAGVGLATVSENKTFLVTSAKLLKDSDDGLALVEGADPSWWEEGDLMRGLPTPEQVRQWWESKDPPPNGNGRTAEHAAEQGQNLHIYAENSVRPPAEQAPNTFGDLDEPGEQEEGDAEHVRQVFGEETNSKNGIGKPNAGDGEGGVRLFGHPGAFGDENVVRVLEDPPGWLAKQLAECREDPGRWIKPTSAAVAAEVYGTAARWREVVPVLQAHVGAPDPEEG